MSIISNASFKNSRVSPRSATATADITKVSVPTGSNTLVVPANPNRTYASLRNENTTAGDDLRYDYFDNASILTQGFLLKAGEAVDIETKQDVYCRATTNAVSCSVDEGQG